MKKALLTWNIILTVLLAVLMFNGCASIDPQFANLENQVSSNRAALEQLTKAINDNRELTSNQAQQMLLLQMSVEANLTQLTTSMQEYVQDYVEAQLK